MNTAMLFSAIYMIFDVCRGSVNCVSSEYMDDLEQEVVELCTKSRADRLEPLQESTTLESRMERPHKAQAVKEHRSRFKAKDDAQ